MTVLLFLLLSFVTDSSAYYFRGQIIPDPLQVPMWSNTPAPPTQQQQPLQSESPNQSQSSTISTSTPTITPTAPTIQSNQTLQPQSTTQLPHTVAF
jgi:hypothetical protein